MPDVKKDWERLGREVLRARLAAGHADTSDWANLVGRSTRTVLGLERGEAQGPRTLALVEQALGWSAGWAHRILMDPAFDVSAEEVFGDVEVPGPSLSAVEPAESNPVIAAIERDPFLLPEAKAHFLNQYELLLRVASRSEEAPLPYAARGARSAPVDPAQEAEIERDVRRAAAANPDAPRKRPRK